MNVFNRVLVTVIALLAIASAVCLLLMTSQLAPASWSDNLLALAWQSDPVVRNWTMTVCFVTIAIGLLLLVLELRSALRRRRLLLKDDGLGQVTVSLRGVEDLVRREAIRLPGIVNVSSRVSEAEDGLHILERVAVAPEANIPEVSNA